MEMIQAERLRAIPGLIHGFFCPGDREQREDNLSYKNGSPEQVLSARRRACGMLRLSATELTHVYQEHGTTIWAVDESQRGAGAITGEDQVGVGDALITDRTGVPLAILIADCLPVYFSTPQAEAIGLAHAGWRGTLDNISGKMVARLAQDYGVSPDSLHVWIGPGISRQNFEVGAEVLDLFAARWSGLNGCLDRSARRIDLKALNLHQLMAAGVPEEHIEVSPHCTYADPRFFSYRRDGAGIGHNMAVICKE